MFLKTLHVHNYKSLRNVEFTPSALTCLVGPNASGKSNFAEALHFLGEVYSHGLEVAIARKGGYESIAYRKKRRSKAAISFTVRIELPWSQFGDYPWLDRSSGLKEHHLMFSHSFAFRAVGTGIKAKYKVEDESFWIGLRHASETGYRALLNVERRPDRSFLLEIEDDSPFSREMSWLSDGVKHLEETGLLSDQALAAAFVPFRTPLTNTFLRELENIQVFRFSPDLSRSPGVPTPNPELDPTGANLPALVDWLQQEHPKRWDIVIDGMRDMVPGLEKVSVQYLHTKALGLFFQEDHAGRPWIADDVSDGTIQALAMLVASVDPRSSVLLIEEPENSVHPWIIRSIVSRFRRLSELKTVILTSHSPPLIDELRPEEVWVTSRKRGETSVRPLPEYDSSLIDDWEQGAFRLSEALDAGLIPTAVPGGSE